MDHNVIITILSGLNIPTCALHLIMFYLSQHKMCVRYNGAESGQQDTPGGGPQGLAVILFDLQFNLAGAPCKIPSLLPGGTASPEPTPQQAGPLALCHIKDKSLKKNYVDDLTFLESINLRLSLVPSTLLLVPLTYKNNLPHPPEQSILHHQLADLFLQ